MKKDRIGKSMGYGKKKTSQGGKTNCNQDEKSRDAVGIKRTLVVEKARGEEGVE